VSSPRVSVVLPVYNGAAYVERAIASVLEQTFVDFELIVIDDGSTDRTARVLATISDLRLHVVSQPNRGLSATLNRGIALARGVYVARQDHDDLSLPTRLAQQVAFMDAHPRCALLGTRAEIYEGDVSVGRFHDHALSHEALRFELLFDNPFVHSSVMLRHTALTALGGYTTDPARQPPEDYELWSRIARSERVANLPQRLVIYREVASSLSRVSARPFLHKQLLLGSENLAHLLGETAPTVAMLDLVALHHSAFDMLSAQPDLHHILLLIERAAQALDPSRTNGELSVLVAKKRRWLRRQYYLRGPLAQRALTQWRSLRARAWTRSR
jgi:hypothetical protein